MPGLGTLLDQGLFPPSYKTSLSPVSKHPLSFKRPVKCPSWVHEQMGSAPTYFATIFSPPAQLLTEGVKMIQDTGLQGGPQGPKEMTNNSNEADRSSPPKSATYGKTRDTGFVL